MRKIFSGWPIAICSLLLSGNLCCASDSVARYSLAEVLEQSEQIRQHKKACGPLSLARVLALLNHPQRYDEVRSEFETFTEDGVELKELLDISKKYWPSVEAVHYADKSLNAVRYPAIALVGNGNHCVVLEGVTQATEIRVWDPATLKSNDLSETHLSNLWTGDLFVFPNPDNSPAQWPQILLTVLCMTNLALGYYLIRHSSPKEPQTESAS